MLFTICYVSYAIYAICYMASLSNSDLICLVKSAGLRVSPIPYKYKGHMYFSGFKGKPNSLL